MKSYKIRLLKKITNRTKFDLTISSGLALLAVLVDEFCLLPQIINIFFLIKLITIYYFFV